MARPLFWLESFAGDRGVAWAHRTGYHAGKPDQQDSRNEIAE